MDREKLLQHWAEIDQLAVRVAADRMSAPRLSAVRQKREARKHRASVGKYQGRGLISVATAAARTAAAAAKFTTRTATAAACAFFARARDVYRESAPIQLLAVHGFDGLLGFFGRTHGDEGEAARAAAHSIHHQVGFNDRAVRREGVLQIVFSGVEGKVSYEQFRTHVMSYCPKLTLA